MIQTKEQFSEALQLRREEWNSEAYCQVRRIDPGLFYVAGEPAQRDVARDICGGCEQRSECLLYAIVVGETLGVWGGATENQRKRLTTMMMRATSNLAHPPRSFDGWHKLTSAVTVTFLASGIVARLPKAETLAG